MSSSRQKERTRSSSSRVLPDIPAGKSFGGNGTFTLHAYAVDLEGNQIRRVTLDPTKDYQPMP